MTERPNDLREAVLSPGYHSLKGTRYEAMADALNSAQQQPWRTSSDSVELDIATVIARLEQINEEDRPSHWLWDRVMTCDVPRLRAMLPEEESAPVV